MELEELLDMQIEHFGVKGMKWGVRKNYVKLDNYKGKAYFITEENMDGKTLIPRVPKNYFTKNGYEDPITERVSFAPSVDKALMGLSQNVTGKKFFVHEPVDAHDIYKPNTKAVPDSDITGELWIKDPVRLKVVGEITATGDSGKPGKSFNYGSSTAELYEFNYEWISKPGGDNVPNEELLQHVGVKGMKWGVRKSRTSKDRASETTPKPKSTLRKYIDSNRRELGMHKLVKDVSTLPDAEVIRRTNRVRNENDFRRAIDNTAFVDNKRRKRLREEYFNRENLSDAELQERVRRLNLEDNLRREVVRASKPQREAANELIKSVSTQAIGMYTDPTTKIFTATGNVAADMMIKEGLKYTKSNKIVPEKYGKK